MTRVYIAQLSGGGGGEKYVALTRTKMEQLPSLVPRFHCSYCRSPKSLLTKTGMEKQLMRTRVTQGCRIITTVHHGDITS